MSKTTTFVQAVSDNYVGTNISYARYLWSNAANWTNGIPTDGDTVVVANYGYDDIASLHLANLTQQDTSTNAGIVRVIGKELVVDQLKSDYGTSLTADSYDVTTNQTPAKVIVNSVAAGSGGVWNADGAGSVLTMGDVDTGHIYGVYAGARLEFLQGVSAYTAINFSANAPAGTLAFYNPGPVIGALITSYIGDTVELPGSTVLDVTFVNSKLTSVTTDQGTTQFTSFNKYQTFANLQAMGAYTISHDATTGLEAIKLLAAEVFTPSGASSAWSNAANWSGGVPLNGDVVTTSVAGVDDLASLDLSGLTDAASLTVNAGSLSIGTYKLGGTLLADASSGQPASIKIDTVARCITTAGGSFGATGAGARFEDDSTTDRGGTYTATNGGRIDLYAAPAASSALSFAGTADTIALHGPAGVIAAALTIGAGDTIEVTGATVSGVAIGANSLAITTDTGTTTFNNVTYRSAATTFVATHDATSGLEAITLKPAASSVIGLGPAINAGPGLLNLAPSAVVATPQLLGLAAATYSAQLPQMLAMQSAIASLFSVAG